MKRFNYLDVPYQWKDEFTRYPHGYTIFEALCKWVKQVDKMVDNINDWNNYLDNFVEQFEFELQVEVKETLSRWQQEGKLDELIFLAIDTRIDEVEGELQQEIEGVKGSIEDLRGDITGIIDNNLTEIISEVTSLEEININKNFINVRDYGAKGDGVTDDTGSFMNALLDLEDKKGYLFVPVGVYSMSQPLLIPEGCGIVGQGATHSKLLWKGSNGEDSFIVLGGNYCYIRDLHLTIEIGAELNAFIEVTNCRGIQVNNVYCLGNNVQPSYGIWADNSKPNNVYYNTFISVTASRCRISGFYLYGGSVTQNTFIGCTANANGSHGYHLRGNRMVLLSCCAELNQGNGVYSTYGECSLYSCYFESNKDIDYFSHYNISDLVIGSRFFVFETNKSAVVRILSTQAFRRGGTVAFNHIHERNSVIDVGVKIDSDRCLSLNNLVQSLDGSTGGFGEEVATIRKALDNFTTVETGSGSPVSKQYPNGAMVKKDDGVYLKVGGIWVKIG